MVTLNIGVVGNVKATVYEHSDDVNKVYTAGNYNVYK